MEIQHLKSKRKGFRIAFTSCANKIEQELLKVTPDLKKLSVLKLQLNDKFERLAVCQEEISNTILQMEDAEETFEEDLEAADLYRDKFCSVTVSIEGVFREPSVPREITEKRKFKLPKIELQKFNGDAKDYLAFWSQFEKIHLDESLPDDDKFQYLLQAMVPQSKAARVVQSFPATAANYPKAVKQLQERFGREDLLVQIYVRELLTMVMKNAISARTKADLPTLYDELEGKLRALESLGRTQEKYGDFLTPLVESCLPEDILIAWERSHSKTDSNQADGRSLENLMCFLKQEVMGEEMVVLARAGFGGNHNKKKSGPLHYSDYEIPSTAALVSTTNRESAGKKIFNCIFCDKKHPSQDCFMARKLSFEVKKKVLLKRGACFSCLRLGHTSRSCRLKNKCIQCDRNHFILMCPDRETSTNENNTSVVSTNALTNNCKVETVLLMTLIVKIKNQNYERKVRALVDTGSQLSYLSNRVIDDLKLKPKSRQKIVHGLFGGKESEPRLHEIYEIKVGDLKDKFSIGVSVFSENKICGFVPKAKAMLTLEELKESGLVVSDLSFKEYEIDLLLGADVAGSIMTSNSIKLKSGVIVLETKLGYTLIGKEDMSGKVRDISELEIIERKSCTNVANVVTLNSLNIDVINLWDLDAIGITDPWENAKNKFNSSNAVKQFQDILAILPDGRYELLLPFKGEARLPNNKSLALKRYENMRNRAIKGNYLNDYIDVFNKWEELKIIEKVPVEEMDNEGHYLPHRPVIKEKSRTSNIRPVFDASAKGKGQPSLNDCLIKGSNLIELIPDIIDRFRLYPIGISSDIEKAFLQLSIAPEHRDYLRFIFPSETDDLKIYRHCRVVFGVTASPFLLMASLHHLFENASEEYFDIIPKLRHSFYVDNCVTGVANLDELEYFVPQTRKLLESACFNLRGWESNASSPYLSNSSGDTSLLGMIWNLDQDRLRCSVPTKIETNQDHTKRTVLSHVQQIFDPLGMLCPATLLPKLLLQDTWKNKLTWDDPLPSLLQKEFSDWLREMPMLEKLQVPRYLKTNETSELHVFVDACKKSYGTCIFLRSEVTHGVKVQLVRAKSRVAPIKDMTIPKLELMACCIGTRLAHSIKLAFDLPDMSITFWSDSMTALWWIREHGEWSIFVSNRVKEIRKLTSPEHWRHVPGVQNPADIASRGCSPQKLVESEWLNGPMWLRETVENWPSNEIFCQKEVDLERRKVKLTNLNLEGEGLTWYALKFSKYESIIRLVAWVMRFVNNVRMDSRSRNLGRLSLDEKEAAEVFLIKEVQSSSFPDSTAISNFITFKDEEGVIRVKTRITQRIDTPSFISPILLPDKCIFTQRLIEHFHEISCHAGTQILLSILREKFWIIRGRKTVRNIVKNCIKCKRYKAKALFADPVSLPADRVRDATVFEVVGIDLAGPLYVKHGDKTWVVLFTCAIYRAVHLELVTSLNTDSFLLAFRRFVARRGRPRVIYCDNGTNFKGAFNSLCDIDWDRVSYEAEFFRISWRFNPPSASWWGGWWERLVRTLKELLKRTLGRAVLTYEELQTTMCDCESVMNARPLTYLSEDTEDLKPLTPAMFLLENSDSRVTDIDVIDTKHCRKRIRYRMKILEELRRRFRQEYLSQLIQRQNQKKSCPNVTLGEIVLVGDDFKKRMNWPLAKVIQLIPGKDGKVRTVKLKTRTGVLTRPIQRVFPLELQSYESSDSILPVETDKNSEIELPSTSSRGTSEQTFTSVPLPRVSRTGRIIKSPQRLDLCNTAEVLSQSILTQKGGGC